MSDAVPDAPPPPPLPPAADGPRVSRDPDKLGSPWRVINDEVVGRSALLAAAYDRLAGYGLHPPVRFRLAATDAFVEKAQHRLTKRATLLNVAGVIAAAASLGVLIYAATYVSHVDMAKRLGRLDNGGFAPGSGYLLTLLVLQSLSVGGFVAGAAYFLAALAKAFFHEGSVLLSRRHALRFGRLFIYLRNGEVEPDLMKAFRWTDEFGSAFEHIKEEGLKAGVGKIFETVPQVVEASAKFVEAAKPKAG